MADPRTRRGRGTKERIVAAAAALMYDRGVNRTSIEDVLAASGTGKSQMYHYFANKDELIAEVLRYQCLRLLERQSAFRLDTWHGIRDWFDTLVDEHENRWHFAGCPLGSLAAEVLDQSEDLRSAAWEAFAHWETALTASLQVMVDRGLLSDTADPEMLAESTIAIMQGGYLLAATKRDRRPMRSALDVALAHLKSYAPTTSGAS